MDEKNSGILSIHAVFRILVLCEEERGVMLVRNCPQTGTSLFTTSKQPKVKWLAQRRLEMQAPHQTW